MSEEQRPIRPGDNSFRGNDPRDVDLDDCKELAYWVRWFDVPEAKLREAVAAVGISAQRIKDYLARSREP